MSGYLTVQMARERLFLNALGLNVTKVEYTPTQHSVFVIYSDNDGVTWSKPIFLSSSNFYFNEPIDEYDINTFDDKNSITADPNDPNYVYVVWDRFANFNTYHSDTYLVRSNNGENTWFQATLIYDQTDDLC